VRVGQILRSFGLSVLPSATCMCVHSCIILQLLMSSCMYTHGTSYSVVVPVYQANITDYIKIES